MVACLTRPPHSAASGGRCSQHSPSAQPLPGWTLQSEVLMREAGTCFLLCACVCAWLGLGVPVLGDRGGPGPGAFTCHNNNILRIECRWPGPAPGQGAGSWLLFTSNVVPGSKHKCVFWADVCTVELPPEEVLVPADNFTITFHRHISGKEQVSLVDPQYLPRRHVKLDPPSDLQSNVSSEHCVLTWSVNPALEPLAMLLSYELAFKRQEEAWEVKLGYPPWGPSVLEAAGDAGLPTQGAFTLELRGRQWPEPRVCECRVVSVPLCVCARVHRACLCG